jgi:membrane fusion protein, adhesin transport system
MTSAPYPRLSDRILRKAHVEFIVVCATAIVLFLLWAAFTSVEQVARGPGRIMPQDSNKIVQHFEGGIVTEILASEGDRVKAGDVLLRIENSFSTAELAQNQTELRAKRIEISRLDAEARGLATFEVDAESDAKLPQIVAKEKDLFKARLESLAAQFAVIDDQIEQKNLELSELNSRLKASEDEKKLIEPKVESLKRLLKSGAVSRNELLDTQRALQQVTAKIDEMRYSIPRAEAAIKELASRRSEAALTFRSDAEKERREVAVTLAKLEQTVTAMQDRNRRSDVVAPIAGTVNRLLVNTVGGVAKPGEPLAQIVPADARIVIESRLSPADRAEIYPGLPAVVKVSAYDFATYGGLRAEVVDISPDALADEGGEPYFRVRLSAKSGDLGDGRPIVPGMQAQVDILKGRQTILAALVRPVRALQENALRQ